MQNIMGLRLQWPVPSYGDVIENQGEGRHQVKKKNLLTFYIDTSIFGKGLNDSTIPKYKLTRPSCLLRSCKQTHTDDND